MNGLAILYWELGDYTKAEPLIQRSLNINEKTLGTYHPNVALSLDTLAFLYGIKGNYSDSIAHFLRAIKINDINRENVFQILSERQKLNFLKQTSGTLFGFLSMAALYMQSDPSVVNDAFNAWIRWKGAVVEAQGRYLDAVTYSDNPQIKRNFDELTNLRRVIARLHLSKPEELDFEQYKKTLIDIETRKEILETELSRLSHVFSFEKMAGKATVDELSVILGKNASYLDYAKINLYDLTRKKFTGSYYILFVLTPGRERPVNLINLGNSEEVDKHINAFLKEMNRPRTDKKLPRVKILKKHGKNIYQRIFKPAVPFIRSRENLFISPDGNLNLIPFEVLVAANGKYLMEDHQIGYIGAGRDILKFNDKTVAKGDVLIMADPDYNLELQEKEKIIGKMDVTEKSVTGEVSRDALRMRFNRIPETKQEADTIALLLKNRLHLNVENYQDKAALEEILFKVQNPRILHLATHGYFLKTEEVRQDEKKIPGIESRMVRSAMLSDGSPLPKLENPMLRSGIVLAGANTSLREGRTDGIVSAEKILGLRLKGTDLVVLSACQTGIGDVQSGEGVFGLKRSLILSGAKTLVLSLWSVPSRETTELMTHFYAFMCSGHSKIRAMRQSKLKLMKKKPNPYFWGAFVVVGAP